MIMLAATDMNTANVLFVRHASLRDLRPLSPTDKGRS